MWRCALLLAAVSVSVGVSDRLVGAPENVDSAQLPDDIRDFALAHVEADSNGYFARKVVKVTDVSVQVVAGTLYKFTMQLATTDCAKPSGDANATALLGDKLQHCNVNEDHPSDTCRVSVWEKKWENFTQVTNSTCFSSQDQPKQEQDQSREKRAFVPGQVSLTLVRPASEVVVEDVVGQDHHDVRKKVLDDDLEATRAKAVDDHMKKLLSEESSRKALRVLQSHRAFKRFVKRFDRKYASVSEYRRKYAVFRENMKTVQFLRETERGTGVYGATIFADITTDEFKRTRLGLRTDLAESSKPLPMMEGKPKLTDLPEKFDWRDKNAVTPVKNQGQCGSCWAFSVTGNIEGVLAVKNGTLLSLSEQELVDCDKGDNGCNGGYMENAYKAIVKIGGIETEDEYKYDGTDEACRFNKSAAVVTISGGKKLTTNETELAAWLVQNGPISIGINANAMQFYMGGVSHPFKFLCSKSGLDHGVLIVGYGTDTFPLFHQVLPFWTVKNSWGPGWGEQGYYRVFRGDETCGVNQMATTAVL